MDKQCVRLQSSEESDWAQLRAGDSPAGSAHEVGRALARRCRGHRLEFGAEKQAAHEGAAGVVFASGRPKRSAADSVLVQQLIKARDFVAGHGDLFAVLGLHDVPRRYIDGGAAPRWKMTGRLRSRPNRDTVTPGRNS